MEQLTIYEAPPRKLRVLVACEYSGTVRDAFRALGHYALSCDLLPTDVAGPQYEGDINDVLYADGWDLLIAHPPCTYLTTSGVVWLHRDPDRWIDMRAGAEFFAKLLNADHIPRRCVENPIMHKYAVEIIGRRQNQVVQPWMFGHAETKATGLWLEGLPNLYPTDNVKAATMALPKRERERLHYLSPSPERWKLRSTTYAGIAAAMAAQWGGDAR